MKIVWADEMKEIDGKAWSEYGIPSLILMENAGIRVTEAVEEVLDESSGRRVVIVAGKGNNGGDGLVAARHLLNAGIEVSTFLMGPPENMTPDTRTNFDILSRMNARYKWLFRETDLQDFITAIRETDVIVDAMYGISFRGALNNFDSRVVRLINLSGKPVVAVDLPSGVEADTGKVNSDAVRANWTVTLAAPKMGLLLEPGRSYVGKLTVADISIPVPLLNNSSLRNNIVTEAAVRTFFQPRPADSHKGHYGHTLIVGGSPGMSGAVVLAASAALIIGSGLVTAAVPQSVQPVVAGHVAEIMTMPLPETEAKTIALDSVPLLNRKRVNVVAVGPGMSNYPQAYDVIAGLLTLDHVPLVIDADGLNALAQGPEVLKRRKLPVVITPHPGEMARLKGISVAEVQANRIETARMAAIEWGVTVVLKGSGTVVAQPDGETYINVNGNPGMATAGSGDVLTGIIAGLIAQGLDPGTAAYVGVYIHGKAGDLARDIKGERALVAGDILRLLPEITKIWENGTREIES